MRKLFSLLLVLGMCGAADAQMAPLAKLSSMTSASIAVTNTYQQALPLETGRLGCVIQNNGANPMYIILDSLGSTTPPTGNITALKLSVGQTFTCNTAGVTVADKIWITGTSADVYVVVRQ